MPDILGFGLQLEERHKRVKMSSSGSDQKNLPPKVARCLTMVTRTKRTKLRKLLLQDGLDQVLLEINDNKLAIKGLKILFQEALPAAKFLLSKHSDPKRGCSSPSKPRSCTTPRLIILA
uniref:ARAD1C15708p n=1 Tax=Blastobotrys adeninivorans TaxID=409370 RepID=A0A060T1D1_BLAAD